MKQPRNQAGFWTAPKDLRVQHLGFGVLGARFRSGASSVQRGDFVMEKAGTYFGELSYLRSPSGQVTRGMYDMPAGLSGS